MFGRNFPFFNSIGGFYPRGNLPLSCPSVLPVIICCRALFNEVIYLRRDFPPFDLFVSFLYTPVLCYSKGINWSPPQAYTL